MTEKFWAKHKATINKAIDTAPVMYSVSNSTSTNKAVHCYYVDTKDVNVSVYVLKTTKSTLALGCLLKIRIKSNTTDKKQDLTSQVNGKIAQSMYDTLSAKYTEQVAKTQLKHNWRNLAFVHKR